MIIFLCRRMDRKSRTAEIILLKFVCVSARVHECVCHANMTPCFFLVLSSALIMYFTAPGMRMTDSRLFPLDLYFQRPQCHGACPPAAIL